MKTVSQKHQTGQTIVIPHVECGVTENLRIWSKHIILVFFKSCFVYSENLILKQRRRNLMNLRICAKHIILVYFKSCFVYSENCILKQQRRNLMPSNADVYIGETKQPLYKCTAEEITHQCKHINLPKAQF